MSSLPFDLINNILEMSSTMKNSKYMLQVNKHGKMVYKFNTHHSGYESINTMYMNRCVIQRTVNVLLHQANESNVYQASDVYVLSRNTQTAIIALELAVFDIPHCWLYFDIDVSEYDANTNILDILRDHPHYPNYGVSTRGYYSTQWNGISSKIAMAKFRTFTTQHGGQEWWFEVKCITSTGTWSYNAFGELDYTIEFVDYGTDADEEEIAYESDIADIPIFQEQQFPMLQIYT